MTSPSSDFIQLTAALGDRYVVERELGHGGMATVYLAQDVKHGRKVAIKVLRPELYSAAFAERFLAEIRTTAGLQHAHILPLFDSGAVDQLLYYVMPYVTGDTLRDRLMRERRLPVADAVRIGADVASALDYAHRSGVIHRDIKPENILFHNGAAMVADFGIAFSLDTAGERLTATGISIGTPAYMSPEQASGERVIDARSDVYALGAVLYEMLGGSPPHTGSSAQAVLAQVLTTDPAPLVTRRPDIPATLAAVVTRALARAPQERWSSAAMLAEALQLPSSDTGPGPDRALAKRRRLPRTRTVLSATVLAVGALAAVRFWPRVSPPPVVTSKRQVTFNGNVENSALSPDGRFLAYVAHGADSLFVFTQDLTGGGNAIRLAAMANADVHTLAWSPDGSRLLMTATAGTTPVAYVMAPLGGETRSIPVSSFMTDIVPIGAWTGDGKRVGLWGRDPKGATRITLFGTAKLDTSAIVLPEKRTTYQGAWSRRTNNFVVNLSTDSTSELWIASTGEAPTRIAISRDSTPSVRNPLWSEDDRSVFALRGLSELVRVPLRRDGRTADGPVQVIATGLELWGTENLGGSALSMSADGKRAAYTRSVQHANILLLDAAGRAQPLTNSTTMKWSGALSPDGKQLAFMQQGDGDNNRELAIGNLWILDLATGASRQVTFGGDVKGSTTGVCVAWSPDGAQLALTMSDDGQTKIGVVAAKGGGVVRIIPDTRTGCSYGIAWAPSKDIVHLDSLGHEVRMVDPVSGKVTIVSADTNAMAYNPVVSDDGRQVAVYKMSKLDGQSGLWIAERGRPARKLSEQYLYPIGWTPDGSAVIADSGSLRDLVQVSLTGRSRVIGQSTSRKDYCTPVRRGQPAGFLCTTFISVSDAWLLELKNR